MTAAGTRATPPQLVPVTAVHRDERYAPNFTAVLGLIAPPCTRYKSMTT
jgi:hypothetical protein